jgi:UDP-glucuronate 4-epimerase
MADIIITGAAGFIGFHTAKALLEDGHAVYAIDDFNPYYDPRLKRKRWDMLRDWDAFHPAEGSLTDRGLLERLFAESGAHLVLHLAAQAGVRYSLINPHSYADSNLSGFVNMIEQARRSHVERFVFASSSSVYGGAVKIPYSENDPVNTPISLYAATKRANELMAYSYTHLYGLRTVGLRFFTVYGEWGRPDMAYWSFLDHMTQGLPIKVFNYGRNSRDFTYIDDAVRGIEAALFREGLNDHEIINLGNSAPVSVTEFIRTLEEVSGIEAEKELVEAQPGDVTATYADIRAAAAKLGFRPATSLREGLERFHRWFNQERELVLGARAFKEQGARR